ncbi:MAG: agmatine deiminase family protein [Rhodobacteraceae bacterium]|nr:agmatine deiminase family protein [Paracoccaceae bacterium]
MLLTWPHGNGDWGSHLRDAERVFAAMAEAIGQRQRVLVACHDSRSRDQVQKIAAAHPAVSAFDVPSNDIWARDHGPITVLDDGVPVLLDFRFNGWGNKHSSELDDALTARLAPLGLPGVALERIDTVMEGGSIESDGAGTIMTTSRCLLHPQRNPDLDRGQLEARMSAWFGARQVLWLDHGELEGDDTDGHIDMLARFVPGNTILYTACDDPRDPHYQPLSRMTEQLHAFRNARGVSYNLIPLPWPPARHDEDGHRLPLSYANFLIINGAVLVPVYQVPTDQQALAVIGNAFPDRTIVPVDALPLIRQHGSLHCASMQIPAPA